MAMCGAAICWSEATSSRLGQLLHRLFDDRRPVIELVEVAVGKRVLIKCPAQASTDADVLAGLHEEFGAFDRRDFGAKTPDDLVGGFRALVMRLQLDEHPRGIFGRIVGARAGKGENAGDGRILPNDRDDLLGQLGHRREGDVLARLGLAKDEAGILLGEKTLWDRDVEIPGQDDQRQGRQQSHELVAEDKKEATVIGAQCCVEEFSAIRLKRPSDAGLAPSEIASTGPASGSVK